VNIPEGWLVLLSAEAVASPTTRQTDLVRRSLIASGHSCEVWPLLDSTSRRGDREFLANLRTWRKRIKTVRCVDVRGLAALPYVAALMLGYKRIPKIALSVEGGPPAKFSLLPRRAMRCVFQVLTTSTHAAVAWKAMFAGPIHVLPPLVRSLVPPLDDADALEHPRIVVRANLDEMEPTRTAIWNFDILKYAFPNLRLQVVGTGPMRDELAAFALSLGRDDTRVDFLGEPDDLDEVLRRAMAIWVGDPVRPRPYAVAEALSAGRTVVTWDHPEHRFGTALLADPADPVGLAKVTHRLLERPLQLALQSQLVRESLGAIDTSAWVREYLRVVGPPSA